MNTGIAYGVGQMLLRILKIPPGVTLRHASSGSSTGIGSTLQNLDFVNAVVDITADDVCIGNSPLFFNDSSNLLAPELKKSLDSILDGLNKIIRWAAVDLLKVGCSIYRFSGDSASQVVHFIPILNDSVSFYMLDSGEVVSVLADGSVLKDALVFLNYSKESLEDISGMTAPEIREGKVLYKITPEPIQLKNMNSVASDLWGLERAMYRYRNQLSRIIRLVTVDVGTSQGDRSQEIIDDVDAAINANSMSLGDSMSPDTSFDDNIPVFPNRRGLGKPEVIENVPNFDISKLADLDYTLSRFFLMARFPKSYADFNQALPDTAVSLIRGDIRYSRMVDHVQSVLLDTINVWLRSALREVVSNLPVTSGLDTDVLDSVAVKLVSLPNSEDDDVVEALNGYSSFTREFFEFIKNSDSYTDAMTKINLVKVLLGDTASLPAVSKWFSVFEQYVNSVWSSDAVPEEDSAEGSE